MAAGFWRNWDTRLLNLQAGLSVRWQIAVFLIALFAVFTRLPGALLHAQFFAEDGWVWYQQAYNLGWTRSLAITHGGFVFALADTAFAIACNDGDLVTVAAGADITFLKATTAGDVLTATAIERAKSGRSGIYDVEVLDANGTIVAEFRGRSRRTNAPAPV